MSEDPPLSALLSKTLVAFTIEFDNEAERRIGASKSRRIFLVSLPYWANYLRFVSTDGCTAEDLRRNAGCSNSAIHSRLGELARWGYVTVEPGIAASGARPRPGAALVRSTASGRLAQATWKPLADEIEARWIARFGAEAIAALRTSLRSVVERRNIGLPRALPVVGYAMFSTVETLPIEAAGNLDLSALLSRALLAFALDFERDWRLSLAMSANVLRVARDEPIRVRDLPRLAGIAKETVAVSLSFLEKHGYLAIEFDKNVARGKTASLTAKGRQAREGGLRRQARIEADWRGQCGDRDVRALRGALSAILDARDGTGPVLAAGLNPPDGGWRACSPYFTQTKAMLADPLAALPDFPIVTHRGGWPDGS